MPSLIVVLFVKHFRICWTRITEAETHYPDSSAEDSCIRALILNPVPARE